MQQTGIYALKYTEQNLIYVGQSIDIKRRYREHIKSMKRDAHTNHRVQKAYNEFGIPELEILQLCSLVELNNKEILWTSKLNSLDSLNIVEAGKVGHGVNSNHSKYTKLQILLVFRKCLQNKLTLKQVSELTEVKLSTVHAIRAGTKHSWLKDDYPFLYSIMQKRVPLSGSSVSKRKTRTDTTGTYLIFKSPEGILHEVTNVHAFSQEHNLSNSCLSYLIKGTRPQHKGWTLVEEKVLE